MKRIVLLMSCCVLIVTMLLPLTPTFSAFTFDSNDYETGLLLDDIVPEDEDNLPEYEGELPSSIDLSQDIYFPPIGNQSGGSCTAWATTYYQFGYQVAAMNGWDAKNDETKRMSPRFIYNYINHGKNKGASIDDAYLVLTQLGCVPYTVFPNSTIFPNPTEHFEWYTNTDVIRDSLKFRVSDYHCYRYAERYGENAVYTPITSPNSASLDAMKSLLCDGNILVISTFFWDLQFDYLPTQINPDYSNQSVCISNTGTRGPHAMAVVGYDDTIWYDYNSDGLKQSAELGAFKLADSHGTSTGNDGFTWVMYDALNKVSNFSDQNTNSRQPVFYNYWYHCITVEEYPVELVAEVTLTQSSRNQTTVKLAVSGANTNTYSNPIETYLTTNTGNLNYFGEYNTLSTATFAFDFYELSHTPTIRKNYYVEISDDTGGSDTYLSKIKLIDSTGHIVKDDIINQGISSETVFYRYRLGVYGDINNDANISLADSQIIGRYVANLSSLNSDESIVADVNNDGVVDIMDKTYLERYIFEIIDQLPAGLYAFLG